MKTARERLLTTARDASLRVALVDVTRLCVVGECCTLSEAKREGARQMRTGSCPRVVAVDRYLQRIYTIKF